jgi:hypothetical protein
VDTVSILKIDDLITRPKWKYITCAHRKMSVYIYIPTDKRTQVGCARITSSSTNSVLLRTSSKQENNQAGYDINGTYVS